MSTIAKEVRHAVREAEMEFDQRHRIMAPDEYRDLQTSYLMLGHLLAEAEVIAGKPGEAA